MGWSASALCTERQHAHVGLNHCVAAVERLSGLTTSMKRQLMPLLAMERRGCELVEGDGVGLLRELLRTLHKSSSRSSPTNHTKFHQR